jgi:hypothetical protein
MTSDNVFWSKDNRETRSLWFVVDGEELRDREIVETVRGRNPATVCPFPSRETYNSDNASSASLLSAKSASSLTTSRSTVAV